MDRDVRSGTSEGIPQVGLHVHAYSVANNLVKTTSRMTLRYLLDYFKALHRGGPLVVQRQLN